MHTDEAINAYIIGDLLSGKPFVYDPQDRHGPALAATALPLLKMQGAKSFSGLTEAQLRLTSVIAGTLTILLLGFAAELFGFAPSVIAALLFAGASLPVYYNRDFIHEPVFVAATLALVLSAWRAVRTQSTGYSVLAAACAAFMLACKETAVLHFFALILATILLHFWTALERRTRWRFHLAPVLWGCVAFVLLTVTLFTWFGRNWAALPALAHAVPSFLSRAGGEGHQKPFWYYLQLLASGRSGALLCTLALAGIICAMRHRNSSPAAFIAIYAAIITALYSLIPYKTPWLALNLWLPLALLAGLAVASLWRIATKHLPLAAAVPVFAGLGAVALAVIAHDTRQRVFLDPAGESNPYAYSQTSDDILGLPDEIDQLAHRAGVLSPRIAVIASDPWPLPWYLRRYANAGFWQPGQRVPDADFYITSTEAANQYAEQLRDDRPDFFGVRPGVLILLWFKQPK